MPELRQDIISGRWAVIAVNRAMRPEVFSRHRVEEIKAGGDCPFCPGNEARTPPEVDAWRPTGGPPNTRGWRVRVVPNKYPAFITESEKGRRDGFYRSRPASGRHEVIIHSPRHRDSLGIMALADVEAVVNMYKRRLRAADRPPVKAALIIVNHGREAGASIEHSHSQLFAVPLVPDRLRVELLRYHRYQREKNACIFCLVVKHELQAVKRVVAENKHFIAFCPFASPTPFTVWLVPKEHAAAFEESSKEILRSFAALLSRVLASLHKNLNDPPYNYWLHSAPFGGGDFHWHLEIAPKLTTPAGFEQGSGVHINVVKPEDAAVYLAGSQ